MKRLRIFVGSLRVVNQGFCSHFEVYDKTLLFLAVKVSFRVHSKK